MGALKQIQIFSDEVGYHGSLEDKKNKYEEKFGEIKQPIRVFTTKKSLEYSFKEIEKLITDPCPSLNQIYSLFGILQNDERITRDIVIDRKEFVNTMKVTSILTYKRMLAHRYNKRYIQLKDMLHKELGFKCKNEPVNNIQS